MGHVDGLLLFLDLMGAVDADRDDGHHVAPPCAVFSPLRCCRDAAPSVAGARIFESRLDPVKHFNFRLVSQFDLMRMNGGLQVVHFHISSEADGGSSGAAR